MRSRALLASTAVVVVTAAGVTVGAAQAQPDSPAARTQAGRAASQIVVVERAVSDTVVDQGPTGDSLGDLLAFGNPVYDRTNTHQVGRDQGSCVRTVVGKAWECSYTTSLAKGALVVEGPFYDTRDSVLAITGGTGSYSRARGVLHLHARNAKGTAFTFRFVVQR
ncbi:dirigent protein [Nocardioides panacis]|uniref:Dirigent protein n=1 Tax=Nocardioides panacis TaxID=2849501 RepID=A0A975T1G5_9ACTN|nr:dirigent protein [Nocardioides panacis]QWZ09285.1 dirigent protein [Nocardioides panacis]